VVDAALRHLREWDIAHSDVRVPGSVVIAVETANACVEQFAETLSRPTVVEWVEL